MKNWSTHFEQGNLFNSVIDYISVHTYLIVYEHTIGTGRKPQVTDTQFTVGCVNRFVSCCILFRSTHSAMAWSSACSLTEAN